MSLDGLGFRGLGGLEELRVNVVEDDWQGGKEVYGLWFRVYGLGVQGLGLDGLGNIFY